MSIYTDNPNLFNEPLRIREDEKADFNLVFAEFFVDYSLSECRDWLLKIVTTCVTDSGIEFDEADKRSDLLHFSERLETVLEAAMLATRQDSLIRESVNSAPHLNETEAARSYKIHLDNIRSKVVDIQKVVTDLAALVTQAWDAEVMPPLP